jgi:hypothetical protein
MAAWCPSAARAQKGGVAVGFKNESKMAVVVQGWTMINGMKKAGQAILIMPGMTQGEINIPAGVRYYSVYDAKMPNKVYISEIPVPVGMNDIGLSIRATPKGLVLQTP